MIGVNPASQVVAALILGLLIALTCQLLLTNLGLAVGITIWGGQSQPNEEDAEGSEEDDALSISLGTLGFAAGFGLLLTVNGVLFVACYGAVKFCAPATAFSGAMLGLAIWSAYLLTMTWISTRATNSLVAFILSSAVTGLRQIFDVLGSVMQTVVGDRNTDALTPAAVTGLVQQEMQSTLDQIDIPGLIEEYIDEQMPPQFQWETLQSQLEKTLQDSDLAKPERQGFLSQLDPGVLVQRIRDELGFTGDIADAIADLFKQIWQQFTEGRPRPLQQLQDLLSSAPLTELTSTNIGELLKSVQQEIANPSEDKEDKTESSASTEETPSSLLEQTFDESAIARQIGATLRQRIDLSDLDVETVWQQISPLLQDWLPEVTSFGSSERVVRDDVSEYLQQLAPWQLNAEVLQQEFQDVLIDPEAATDQVLAQVQALKRDDLIESLQRRGDLTTHRVEALATELEELRQSAIATLTSAHSSTASDAEGEAILEPTQEQADAIAEIQQKLEDYLHYTSLSQISSESLHQKVQTLVEDSPVAAKDLHQVKPQLPLAPLVEVLDSRQGLESDHREQILQQVQAAWQQSTDTSESISSEVAIAIEGALLLGISQLIANPINVQDLLPKLMEPLEHVVSEPTDLRRSLNQIDWAALHQKAQSQLNASDTQIEQAIYQVRVALIDFLKPPKRWALRRTAAARGFWDSVTEYFAHSSPDQLEPEAVRRNLAWLWQLSNPGLDSVHSLSADIIQDVSQIDWNALKQVLSQRKDLAVEQVEAIWPVVEAFLEELLHQANRARQQAQASLESWFETVKVLLQDSEQLSFDPRRLKADVRSLLKDSSGSFAALVKPLKVLESEGFASAIAQMSQDAMHQLLKAQGVPELLLAQAEGIQTWIYDRLIAVEQDIQQRQTALKQAALQQLNDARKALAAAAWWLFAIALTSAITAAGAGIVAAIGFTEIFIRLN
ncbi:hypothetical protein PN498_07615 [Oscillatoria sp. CS-180]|uniref:hypothetical protein n=1 Tax=Oscillatoria sp. CS-180 TaxID=3021720 RepID=UPI00232CF018|nr:hypothetical protein [Oscillatoria sp. CS-180]MDB9525848.1 hypothetical protein [Oscillatoria sp. CS-180]